MILDIAVWIVAASLLSVIAFLGLCYGVMIAQLAHDRQPGPAPLLPPLFLQSVAREFAVSLLMVFLWPVGLLRRGTRALSGAPTEAERVPGSDPASSAGPVAPLPVRRPVLLLHGYGMNSMSWAWLGRALRRLGLGPLYTATYFSPQSIERSASQLSRMVDEVLQREGAARLDIIAHSLGGLVARYYIEWMGGKVATLVTLGTPHQGTMMSRFGLGAVRHELGRGPTLPERPVRPPPGVRYLSIYSTADELVIPSDSARILAEGEDPTSCVGRAEMRLDGLGHLSLLASPEVARLTATALRMQEEQHQGAAPA